MSVAVSSKDTLDNLVAQFARPMDCLRELVQNAMDAGTPRVDVWLAYADGVLEIHVDDAGSGMDEAIIDQQLTKLFSSTKEGDRTKIGKFGIGFSSIFAIQPDAVLLRTGRHGENWELVFHPDRSYDKTAIDEPVQGTQITLYKRMAEGKVEAVVHEARDVLSYWCEHASTPIHFADRTATVVEPMVDTQDPFAAFAEVSPAAATEEAISGPLAIDAVVQVAVDVEGIEALVGVGVDGPGPYGFYNGGLTLVSTDAVEVLGEHHHLQHLCFKVRCDQLEHTLTRDNVLQDETFERVLSAVSEARDALVEVVVNALKEGGPHRDRLLDFLVAEHRVSGVAPAPASAIVLHDVDGEPWRLDAALVQADRYHAVLIEGPSDPDLDLALRGLGVRMLPDRRWVRPFAEAWATTGMLWWADALPVCRPRDVFVQPDVRSAREGVEAELLRAARQLMAGVGLGRVSLALGAFDEGIDRPELVVAGPRGGGVFLRRTSAWQRLSEWLGWRHLVINTVHPFYRSQLRAAEHDAVLAAQGLLMAVLRDDESDHRLVRLAQAALVEVRR